jgi:transposase
MSIVGGLDLHRKQITFDVVDTVTGQVSRGRICPSNRETFRGWLGRFAGQQVELAVEGCTGWRFVVEECRAVGVRAHLAEPAEVAGLRGRRRHPKTDRLDAQHLRELLEAGTLPRSWIPPTLVLEMRAKVRLYRQGTRTCSTSGTGGCSGSRRCSTTTASRPSTTCSAATGTGSPACTG